MKWVVHKFGGTSLGKPELFRSVAEIVAAEPGDHRAIVVSAMSGVTNALIDLVNKALERKSYDEALAQLLKKHAGAARDLLPFEEAQRLEKIFELDAKNIGDVLHVVQLTRTCSERTLELVSGHGELWSAQILEAFLRAQGREAAWLDARQVLTVEPGDYSVSVDWKASQEKTDAWMRARARPWLVVTGFVASTPDGIATTLKRNGSDFSASIFGALLKATTITIWTDVDGVLSADPRMVPEAVVLEEMSYDEATELAYFGAKVVHPATMSPAIGQSIPIFIRNTFNAKHPGTKIHRGSAATPATAVKGFASIDKLALINVEGTGMIGVPGVAHRLFGALREIGVSVVMISQASSEHSICFAVPQNQADKSKAALEKTFFAELHHGQIERIDVLPGCACLAAVGDGMSSTPGVAAKFFGALGAARINVLAIAQGSSERNISAVISGAEAVKALRAVHAAFFLSNQTLSIGLIGPGLVGEALLQQIESQRPTLLAEHRIDLRVRALIDSRRMLLSEQSLGPAAWAGGEAREARPAELEAFLGHVQAEHLPHCVIVDCSSDAGLAAKYADWVERGLHIVTPNKKAGSGPLEHYKRLQRLSRRLHKHWLYETTVGAALPVINTLRDLVQTGDRVRRIEGILSGSLSYILSALDGGRPWSEIVLEARSKGYTEPDPRDDLSGSDVARKLVILARECGLDLEMQNLSVESLLPASLEKVSREDFIKRLPECDAAMKKRNDEARARGEFLRYVGVVEPGGRSAVSLTAVGPEHPFAQVRGGDNVIAFYTDRYATQPLVVRGPGAGPAVTASGVFADLLRLSSYLGGVS